MSSLVEKVEAERQKNLGDNNYRDFENLAKEMERLGLDNKASYTLPQRDTIGKTYHLSLGKNIKF